MSDDSYDMPDAEPDTEISGGAVWADPKVEDSPVIPLGFYGGKVVFALPEGELREELASKIPGMLKTDLFVSRAGRAFLINWKDPEGKFQRDMATQWFVNACREQGRWDNLRPKRGYGVWPSSDGVQVHVGDAIGRWPFAKDSWRSVTQALRETKGGPIWLLRPPVPRPVEPAGVEVGREALRHMRMWSFADLGDKGLSDADVVLGWQGGGLLGAVPAFRPHASVSGGNGTGKTTLSRFMQALGSANAGDLLDQFTEAGIKNSLSGEARALYLDEAEPTPGGDGPVERVMEVLRRMSTGEGSAGRKGDIGGQSVATSAVGAAYLASIYPLALGDAMATRMVEVRLRPLGAAKGADKARLNAAIDWAREVSPALLARAIRDVDRYRNDVAMMLTALGEAGRLPRTADLIAALASGRRLLVEDEALTLEMAREEVTLWSALLENREEASTAQNVGQACLSRLFATNSGQHSHDRHLTLGEVIEEAAISPGYKADLLKAWGLKVENGHANSECPGVHLVISTNHAALKRAFQGSDHANWSKTLEYLADLGDAFAIHRFKTPQRFGLHQSRAFAVPLAPWLAKPIAVGVDRKEASAFDPPDWHRNVPPASHEASQGESHD